MRELFGNPADGTFTAWLADGGLWAIIIIVSAFIGWIIARRVVGKYRDIAIVWADDNMHRLHFDYSPREHSRFYTVITDLILGGAIIGTAAALGSLSVLGVDVEPALNALADIGIAFRDWWTNNGFQITLILILAFVANKVADRTLPGVMRRFVQKVSSSQVDAAEYGKRSETLIDVARGGTKVIVAITASMMILSELSVPIGPILGGFGIAGLAVGFGAQWLIRDLINGIFILAENQYRQGDVVTIAGTTGKVESINLRRTTLRDLDGRVHVIPNGEITVASNYTKHWSNIHMEIGVAYKENMQHVFDVLNQIGESLANDPYFGEMIIEAPKVLRLNSFDDSAITIKILGVCKPLTQWEIKGEMNRRIKERFDEEGIEIPFPHQTIYWGYGAHPQKGNQGTEWVEPGEIESGADEEPDPEGAAPAYRPAGLADSSLRKPLPSTSGNGAGKSAGEMTDEQRRDARDLEKIGLDDDNE